jgi:hypothetical protein
MLFFTVMAMYAGSVALPLFVTRGLHQPPSAVGVLFPDGTELLVGSRVGITHDYQKVHGSRQRVARVDLRTGHGALVWPIFLDDELELELEREHDDFRWLRRPPHQPVTLHPDLAAQLQPADSTDNERNLQRSAYQARQLAGFALQHACDILRQRPDTTDPSPYLLRERLRDRMWFCGEGREGGGDLVDVGADVGGGGTGVAAPVGVPGVGMGHGVAEVAFHPGQRGVAQPVGADLVGRDPGQVLPYA